MRKNIYMGRFKRLPNPERARTELMRKWDRNSAFMPHSTF
jgi:hypothetical protein